MTERTFRIYLGAGLFLLLYISALNGNTDLILYYIGILVFEGVTSWHLPKIFTAIKNKANHNEFIEDSASSQNQTLTPRIPFEAESAMRLVVALILLIPLFFSIEILWIIPWFVASMLLLAGVTNICPMVMFFRWLGFR
ncbi:MAG: DUF2892 domain-containing protein [Gammaproteobacteria bacterium]|nr:DUF2892 domain-containing protein [Gammaproteobacteria bacterium]